MIFAVTGVHEHQFNRLVKALDELVGGGVIQDVVIQTGYSTYIPQNCKWSKAIDFDEFEKYIAEADVVVSHGGAGCIAGALERNKPIIVVPRLRKHGEHNNDHQLELASVLEKAGRVLVLHDINNLGQMIEEARTFKPKAAAGESNIARIVREFLMETAAKKGFGD